jgi:hypothetical protein
MWGQKHRFRPKRDVSIDARFVNHASLQWIYLGTHLNEIQLRGFNPIIYVQDPRRQFARGDLQDKQEN